MRDIGISLELEPIRHFGLGVERHPLKDGIAKNLVAGAVHNIAHVFLVQAGVDICFDIAVRIGDNIEQGASRSQLIKVWAIRGSFLPVRPMTSRR